MGLFRKKKKGSKSVAGDEQNSTFTESRIVTTALRQKPAVTPPPPPPRKPQAERLKQKSLRMSAGTLESKPKTTSWFGRSTKGDSGKSWLTQTKYFQEMCDSAFQLIDQDGSGEVDEKELYSGLLLIHLKLGCYAGPAACRPLSRERCHTVFLKFDADNSGFLDKEEFNNVMGVLFGNVLSRVLLQYSMTIMIVPFVAKLVVDGIGWGTSSIWTFVSNLDEHSSIANQIELLLYLIVGGICNLYRAITPGIIQTVGDKVAALLDKVPESVWMSLPLTLTSALLGCLIVPRTIFMLDDFFQHLADRKAKKKRIE